MPDMKRQRHLRKTAFCNEWTAFLRECRANNIKMNQTIGAERLGIKRSTFSDAINNGPTDAILLRFYLFTGVHPSKIEPSLSQIEQVRMKPSEQPRLGSVDALAA